MSSGRLQVYHTKPANNSRITSLSWQGLPISCKIDNLIMFSYAQVLDIHEALSPFIPVFRRQYLASTNPKRRERVLSLSIRLGGMLQIRLCSRSSINNFVDYNGRREEEVFSNNNTLSLKKLETCSSEMRDSPQP